MKTCARLLLLLLTVPAVGAQPIDQNTAKVDAVFAAFDRPGSPGCALGVVRDGALIYARGYGSANLELNIPLSPQSVLDIGSTSKQFSAASIVLLQQQGKLSIDDDVRRHIPELPDYGKKLTVRHLLNHTSGLRDYLTLFSLAGVDFDGVTTSEDALRLIVRQKRLNFEPGSEYLYSNSGFFLLSEIVKRASGKSLRDFAAEHIFTPLGMAHTQFNDDHTRIIPMRATGYSRRDDGGFRIDMSGFEQTGDGAVQTSVGDLLLWDQSFYSGKVGGQAMWNLLLTNGLLNNGEKIDYALGLSHENYRGLSAISHGGSWAGYRAQLIRFPSERFSVICLCNLGQTDPSRLAKAVADVYLADKLKRPEERTASDAAARPVTLTEAEMKRFVGAYRSPSSGLARRISILDGTLRVDSFGPNRTELTPLGGGRFRAPGAIGVLEFASTTGTARPAFSLVRDGAKPEVFEPVEQFAPTTAQLAEFAGTYSSDELLVSYALSVEGDTLMLRVKDGRPRAMTPAVRDAFVAQGQILEFQRNAQRRITGFTVQAGRVRNIAFTRT